MNQVFVSETHEEVGHRHPCALPRRQSDTLRREGSSFASPKSVYIDEGLSLARIGPERRW